MELNDKVVNELTEKILSSENIEQLVKSGRLTTKGLGEAQLHTQQLVIETNKIIQEVAEQNPKASEEEVLKMANNRLTELMAERDANKMQENQESRD